MTNIIHLPRHRQAARTQHKGGIAGLFFWGFPLERQTQRILEMRATGMPRWLIARLVRR
jgi:hypothetical protein